MKKTFETVVVTEWEMFGTGATAEQVNARIMLDLDSYKQARGNGEGNFASLQDGTTATTRELVSPVIDMARQVVEVNQLIINRGGEPRVGFTFKDTWITDPFSSCDTFDNAVDPIEYYGPGALANFDELGLEVAKMQLDRMTR
jgi:hypothetical protein